MTRTLRRPIFSMTIAVIAAMWFASAAQAGAPTFSPVPVPRPQAIEQQKACATRDSVIDALGKKYGEVRRGAGLTGPSAMFEIWASKDTGTWTILKTTPNGFSCIIAVGDSWHDYTVGAETISGDPA